MSEAFPHRAETGAGIRTVHIHPPLLAGILLLSGLLIHLLAGPHHRVVQLHHLSGLLLVAAGVGLSSYAAALFAARDTTKNPYGQPAAFVIVAPYTFTRNPMYLGLTTLLLGFALFFGSAAMLLAPIVFVVVIDRMVIPQEEHTMEKLFGQQYRDYKNRVWRWLPFWSLPWQRKMRLRSQSH
jgi:protein-S-isoprenylcysteine O-methyltransferase Ste14